MFTSFVETGVGFSEKVYRVHEDEGSISPALVLDKALNCCINIRAVLRNKTGLIKNKTADGKLCSYHMCMCAYVWSVCMYVCMM